MTIDIHSPELEALILQRVKSGGFDSAEAAIRDALTFRSASQRQPDRRTGADLIAALQASPFRELEIEPKRYRLPVREPGA